MKVTYIEVKLKRGYITIHAYTPEQYAAKRAKDIARARLQERLGAIAANVGFFIILISAAAKRSPAAVAALGVLGLCVMTAGLYAAHAFYGQEDKRQWK